MDLLFIWPPFHLPKIFVNYPTLASLGWLSCAAALREHGARVRLLDSLLVAGRPQILANPEGFGLGAPPDALLDDAPRSVDAVVVGCSMFQHPGRLEATCLPELFGLLAERYPGKALILADCYPGGIDYFPYDARRVLEACPELDAVCLGEGESILPELLERLLAGRSPAGLERVAWRRGSSRTPVCGALPGRRRIGPDPLAAPAFDLLDMEAYFELQRQAVSRDLLHEFTEPRRILPWMASRGCPFACGFCAGQFFGSRQRRVAVPRVLKQLDEAVERFGAEQIFFMDDCLNADPAWFEELSRGLARRKLAWEAPNGLLARNLSLGQIANMARAGLRRPALSAESAAPRVVARWVGKKQDPGQVRRAVGRLAGRGIPPRVHFIIGFPGESRPEMQQSLALAAELAEDFKAEPRLQMATPVPATPMHAEARRRGLLLARPEALTPLELFASKGLLQDEDFEPEVLERFRAALHRRLAAARPASLVLAPSYACNNHCSFCCTSRLSRKTRSNEDLIWALRRGRELGLGKLDIDGGEPSLWQGLPDFLRLARQEGYEPLTLVTNGRMFTYAGLARELAAAGLDAAVVSLHGACASTHDRVAGVKGAFEQSRQGVRNLLAAGVEVQGSSLLLQDNVAELARLAGVWRSLGASGLSWLWPLPEGRAARARIFPPLEPLARELGRAACALPFRAQLHHLPACLLDLESGLCESAPIKTATRMLARTRRLESLGRKLARHFIYVEECSRCSERVACSGVPKSLFEQGLRPRSDFKGLA